MIKSLECRVPPLVLVLLFATLMWLSNTIIPMARVTIPGAVWLATIIATLGAIIAVLGVAAFHGAATTVDPRDPGQTARIVSKGIYRISRNPMYLGFSLLLLAWGIYLQEFMALPLLALFVVYLTRFQIVPEERQLREKFGNEYDEYSFKASRWF